MMPRSIIPIALLVASTAALAQTPAAVHSFAPGSGQSSGQEPQHFPANVLGLPDASARRSVPAIDPRQIASLGMGGEIVLRFDEPIVDGDGVDFTVFENAFYYTIGPRERLYAEPAEVSVSRDGETWTRFAFDTLTLAGCAGTAPTYGDGDPFDPRESGGNGFDLAVLGVDSIRFVRVRDVTALVAGNPEHPFWDPTLSGFDLDAVVAIPVDGRTPSAVPPSLPMSPASPSSPTREALSLTLTVAPNPATDRLRVAHTERALELRIVDVRGEHVLRQRPTTGSRSTDFDLSRIAPGAYLLEVIDVDGRRGGTLVRIAR